MAHWVLDVSPQLESHVTDLVTGFAGVVVEQRLSKYRKLLLVVPDRVVLGRKAAAPRWIRQERLRRTTRSAGRRRLRRAGAPHAGTRIPRRRRWLLCCGSSPPT